MCAQMAGSLWVGSLTFHFIGSLSHIGRATPPTRSKRGQPYMVCLVNCALTFRIAVPIASSPQIAADFFLASSARN
uniref:Putative secreted protein n=1 Tax=Anopheles darlingi TaxID=43151 RepID=A0A2M4D258_ANODA